MLRVKEAILFVLTHATLSYGWPPANYSKEAATYGIGALDDEVDWSQHPCRRECKDDETPMSCRYGFTVENYATMSKACFACPRNVSDCHRLHCLPANGQTRTVIVVNRRLPGQTIEVCKNDRVIVDVSNQLNGESTTIHWHGLHQRHTPFMDGVPMISQCPIAAGDSFRYEFVAGNAGTHWWHSHSGVQRGDGLFGGLIVRSPPSQNLVGRWYDRDEHMIILDGWSKRPMAEAYPLQYHTGFTAMDVDTILVNGLGPSKANKKSALIPRPVFSVKKDTRYRFRVLNAASYECTVRISVDQHPLLVVSSDGSDVVPLEVDAIRLVPAERYDFVINTNRPVGNYWIRFSGGAVNCDFKHQEAILRYEGAAEADPVEPTGFDVDFELGKRLLNPKNQGSETDGAMCVSCSLRSFADNDRSLVHPTADSQIYLSVGVSSLDNVEFLRKNFYGKHQVSERSYTFQINHLSYKMPNHPLQTQPELIGPHQLCNVTEAKCTLEQCSCPHVLQLKLNSTVELIFVSEAKHRDILDISSPHGMHLHGFYFRVLAMETLGRMTSVEEVMARDKAGKIRRKLNDAPWKDVLDVPSGGYAVVRLRADNPGYWFLHCHFEAHMHNGMAMVLKVGEHKDFPPVPTGFPKCHYDI